MAMRIVLRAALEGQDEIVEYLLSRGASTESRTASYSTPLHLAAARAHQSVVAALLQHSASPVALDDRGQSPLLLACKSSNIDILNALLAANPAALNQQAEHGVAPIHEATRHNNLAAVQVLIDARADIDITDHCGDSAVSIAAKLGHAKIIHALYPPMKINIAPSGPASLAQRPLSDSTPPSSPAAAEAASDGTPTTIDAAATASSSTSTTGTPTTADASTTPSATPKRAEPITQPSKSWWDMFSNIGARKPEATSGVKRLAIVGDAVDLVTRVTSMLQLREMKSNNPLVLARAFSSRKPLRVDDANLVVLCVDLAKISLKSYIATMVSTLRRCEKATIHLSHNRSTAYVILFALYSPSDALPADFALPASSTTQSTDTSTANTTTEANDGDANDGDANGDDDGDGDDDADEEAANRRRQAAADDQDDDDELQQQQQAAVPVENALVNQWRQVLRASSPELSRAVELDLALFVSTQELASGLQSQTSNLFQEWVRRYMAFNHKGASTAK
jgi:hypothetical protein